MLLVRVLAAGLLLAALPLQAHEFWLWPESFAPAVGSEVSLEMMVGEQFAGEPLAMTRGHVAALKLYAGRQADPMHPGLPLSPRQAGTQMLVFDSQPSLLTLPADRFHAYLHDEGLDDIIVRRERTGSAALPGRERFRRHVKSLLKAGGKSDATFAIRTGQRLEIVPLADPLRGRPGGRLGFRILFDGRPLDGALVKAWHRREGQTMQIRARTGKQGDAFFLLPWSGPWMISVVHMIAVTGEEDVDWDSFWGNLTFALGNEDSHRRTRP